MEQLSLPHTQTILLVDDDLHTLRLLELILAKAGYGRVVPFADPTHVVDAHGRHAPHLTIMDMHMAGMSGLRLLEAIREREGRVSGQVLLLTGDDDPALLAKARFAGAALVLLKPFTQRELLEKVAALLQEAPPLLPENPPAARRGVSRSAAGFALVGNRVQRSAVCGPCFTPSPIWTASLPIQQVEG